MATDDTSGSNSLLVLELMDPQSGIFARGLSVELGTTVENACESVEKLPGVDMRQSPIKVNIDCLGHLSTKL